MSTQGEFQFGRKGPEVTQDELLQVSVSLYGKGWVKASQIEEATGIDDRRLRAIAEASDGLIISGPGCPGYKLLTGATELGDVDQAATRLESQAKRMLHRALSLRRRAHAFLR